MTRPTSAKVSAVKIVRLGAVLGFVVAIVLIGRVVQGHRMQLVGAEQLAVAHQGELTRVENILQSATDAGERTALEERQKQLKGALSGAMAQVQRLRGEESDAAGMVAAEQGRWSDINQQLDELDRILRKP